MKRTIINPIFAGLLAAGCALKTAPPAVVGPPRPAQPEMAVIRPPAKSEVNPYVIQIYMYRISMPYGAVSQNPEFWKVLDEDVVDLPTQLMLQCNGLRIGPTTNINAIRLGEVMSEVNFGLSTSLTTAYSGRMCPSVDMTPYMPDQILFVIRPDGRESGRHFGRSRNQFMFSFERPPHDMAVARMTLCPQVELAPNPDALVWPQGDDEQDDADKYFNKVESLYDLGVRADIGPDQLLVIAPSPIAEDLPLSVGRRFMVHEAPLQRVEELLILSQKQLDLIPVPTTRPVTASAAQR